MVQCRQVLSLIMGYAQRYMSRHDLAEHTRHPWATAQGTSDTWHHLVCWSVFGRVTIKVVVIGRAGVTWHRCEQALLFSELKLAPLCVMLGDEE